MVKKPRAPFRLRATRIMKDKRTKRKRTRSDAKRAAVKESMDE